jgi:peroxiredoxin
VQGRLAEFERRGAQVIAVGQGTGAEAAAAARRHRITYPVLGDPGHQSYRKLGLGRTGWWGLTLAPFFEDLRGSWENLKRADLAASRSPRSDVRRLGGAMVVDASGRIRFLHRSQTTTDVPKTDALLAAIGTLSD